MLVCHRVFGAMVFHSWPKESYLTWLKILDKTDSHVSYHSQLWWAGWLFLINNKKKKRRNGQFSSKSRRNKDIRTCLVSSNLFGDKSLEVRKLISVQLFFRWLGCGVRNDIRNKKKNSIWAKMPKCPMSYHSQFDELNFEPFLLPNEVFFTNICQD